MQCHAIFAQVCSSPGQQVAVACCMLGKLGQALRCVQASVCMNSTLARLACCKTTDCAASQYWLSHEAAWKGRSAHQHTLEPFTSRASFGKSSSMLIHAAAQATALETADGSVIELANRCNCTSDCRWVRNKSWPTNAIAFLTADGLVIELPKKCNCTSACRCVPECCSMAGTCPIAQSRQQRPPCQAAAHHHQHNAPDALSMAQR